jgi:hypothetical protein
MGQARLAAIEQLASAEARGRRAGMIEKEVGGWQAVGSRVVSLARIPLRHEIGNIGATAAG